MKITRVKATCIEVIAIHAIMKCKHEIDILYYFIIYVNSRIYLQKNGMKSWSMNHFN